MHKRYYKRFRTLSKLASFDNTLLKYCYGVFAYILCANLAHASEIPVYLEWWQPEGFTKGYHIEISDEPQFGHLQMKGDTKTNSFDWSAPREGVYHWRVTPLERIAASGANPREMVETSSFASGSFVALGPARQEGDPSVRLRWTAVPGVLAYHVRVRSGRNAERIAVSLKNETIVAREQAPLIIRVLPHSNQNNSIIAKDALNRFDPSLQIAKESPEASGAAVAATPRELLVGNQEERQSLLPLPAAPGKVELIYQEDEFVPDERLSEFLLGVYGGLENTAASKNVITRQSRGEVLGGLASLRVIPVVGLQVFGQVEAHNREAAWRNHNGETLEAQRISPVIGQIGVGFDTFFRNPNRRHQLVVEARGAMMQMPMISEDPGTDANDGRLKLSMNSGQLVGGGLWYRWTLKRWSVGLRGSMLVQPVDRSDKHDATLDEWGGFFSYEPTRSLTLQLGAWSRYIKVSACADDEAICNQEGSTRTRVSQLAAHVSMGYVVY